jgi:hypothetical protein
MANSYLTPSIIGKESMMQLKNQLRFAKLAHRQYKNEFVKIGDTVTIRKPVKFYTADGATRVNQDVEEGSTSIVINQRKHVSWKFSTQDLTLTIEEYSKRYIQPATLTLAQTIDSAGAGLYKNVWNSVGTPGTTPNNYAAVAAAAQRATEMAVPPSDRKAVLNSAAFHAIAATLTTLNMPQMAMQAWESGEIGNLAGFRTFESVNLKNHTVGTKAGTPLVNGAAQVSTYAAVKATNTQNLVTDGWTPSSAVLKAGDVITIAGVYAVNPVPGEGTTGKTVMPYLQQFVVNADVSSDGSGNATLSISPAIITSGPYQTVSAAPADNAAITVMGTASTAYPQNLCFHENAFALVTVPLEMPDGAAWKERVTDDGISIRVVKDYDITNDEDIIRLDVLYGWKAIYPDIAVRLWG